MFIYRGSLLERTFSLTQLRTFEIKDITQRHHPAILSFVKYFFFSSLPPSLSFHRDPFVLHRGKHRGRMDQTKERNFHLLKSLFFFLRGPTLSWKHFVRIIIAIFSFLFFSFATLFEIGIILFFRNIRKFF